LNTIFIYDRPRMPLLGRRGPMRDYGNGMPKFMHSFFFFLAIHHVEENNGRQIIMPWIRVRNGNTLGIQIESC
jgi:hypothetical protein